MWNLEVAGFQREGPIEGSRIATLQMLNCHFLKEFEFGSWIIRMFDSTWSYFQSLDAKLPILIIPKKTVGRWLIPFAAEAAQKNIVDGDEYSIYLGT